MIKSSMHSVPKNQEKFYVMINVVSISCQRAIPHVPPRWLLTPCLTLKCLRLLWAQVKQLGELGLMGVAIDTDNGGAGLDYLVRGAESLPQMPRTPTVLCVLPFNLGVL